MNAEVVVKAAIDRSSRKFEGQSFYQEVWCVLDVESISRAEILAKALELAAQKNINVCLSNPSFEVWLLAHFERTPRFFHNSGEVEAYLESKYWKPEFGCDYDKGDEKIYEKVAQRLETAIANAAWVLANDPDGRECWECNSSTEVGRLIVRLRSPEAGR